MLSKFTSLFLLIIFSLLISGCETVSYYYQSAVGQISLSSQRQPIEDLLNESVVDKKLMQRLHLVEEIRIFSRTELKLPVENSYSSYVDLQRRYVIWNVYAAPEFSVDSYKWCFLVVGCVSYRGYFSEKDAIKKAKQLKIDGYDVHVGGIAAYSTLGWFNDPVLSTFIQREELGLVSLLTHELAHKQVFIKGDTAFNESFATAVANRGLQLWLEKEKDLEKSNISLMKYMYQRKQNIEIIKLVMFYRDKLQVVYQNHTLSVNEKRSSKKVLLKALNETYLSRKEQADWNDDYDSWISTMNNAKLATVANYQRLVPAFDQMLKLNGFDMEAFYLAVSKLSKLPEEKRKKHLLVLLEEKSLSLK